MNNKNNNNNDKDLWTHHQTDNAQNLLIGHPRQDVLYRQVKKMIKKGKILEIGFGDGYLLRKLSSEYESHGADISESNIKQMKEKVPQVDFKLVDVDGKLPYDDNFFNGFVASEVFEHMDDKELKICVNEIKRVLAPNGIAVITFPANEKLEDNDCFCPNCKTKFHKWGHKQSWNEQKIKNVFSEFKILKIKKFFTRYKGSNSLEKTLGLIMWLIRTLLNKIIKVDNSTYLLILKK